MISHNLCKKSSMRVNFSNFQTVYNQLCQFSFQIDLKLKFPILPILKTFSAYKWQTITGQLKLNVAKNKANFSANKTYISEYWMVNFILC